MKSIKIKPMKLKVLTLISCVTFVAGCQTLPSMPQTNPGGKAVMHNEGNAELPEEITPNDATISLYSERRLSFIRRSKERGRLYTIQPKGNAIKYQQELMQGSQILARELSEGYILSYLYFENGAIRYNGKAKDGRFVSNIDDETLFYSHSTGKSITSYIVGHAICDGYIRSMDELIDWPMMSATLYQGQPLRNLLNMNAGDKHTVDPRSTRINGSPTHHRDMGLDTAAALLAGTKKRIGDEVFYNNVLADVIANYVAFKAGDNYDELMRKVFQDKVKIEHPVSYQKHTSTLTDGRRSAYYGQAQTLASYSYYITRFDFLRIAEAMMKDYQNQTCVGKYLKESQTQAKNWPKYRPSGERRHLWLHNYAKKYGAQFYFDFHGMSGRNILATEGYNGQNMMIDMDNSRIVVTNSAATAWDQRVFMLNVIKDGELPK